MVSARWGVRLSSLLTENPTHFEFDDEQTSVALWTKCTNQPMFCSTLYLIDQSARVGQRLYSSMCPSPSQAVSVPTRGRISNTQSEQVLPGEPKRKQAICYSSNPVLQNCQGQDQLPAAGDRTQLELARSAVDNSHHAANGRQSCEFITFKGLSSSQYRKEVERKASRTTMDSASRQPIVLNGHGSSGSFELKMVAHDDFHTVNLAGDAQSTGLGAEPQQLSVADLRGINGKGGHEDQAPEKSPEPKPPFMFAGILGCLAATFFFSLSVLCFRLLPNSGSIQGTTKAMWFRGMFLSILCGTTIIYQKSTFKIKRDEIPLNLIRTFVGFFGSYGAYISLKYITLGESTALIYSSPVWTSILSHFILGERFPLTLILAIPVGFFGIIMIAHPDLILGELAVEEEVLTEVERHNRKLFVDNALVSIKKRLKGSDLIEQHHEVIKRQAYELVSSMNSSHVFEMVQDDAIELDPNVETELYFEQRWPGILIALGTSFIVSIIFIVLKSRKSTPIQTATFYLGLGTVLLSTIIQCFTGFGAMPDTQTEWFVLLAMGVNSWLGQALLQWSLQYEKASVLSIVRTMDVVMAFCWSAIFVDEDILWTSIVGAIVIMFIVVLLMANDFVERVCCAKCKK